MIPLKAFRLYSHVVDGIMLPREAKRPIAIVYFSENSTFINDFNKLNFRPMDLRVVVVPYTKYPRTLLTNELRMKYREFKLFPYSTKQRIPMGRNVIFDTTPYMNQVDSFLKPQNYRQRAGFLIKDLVEKAFSFFPDSYRKIFMYSIDVTSPFKSFINRRFFPFLQLFKEKEYQPFFDDLMLVTISESAARYRLLVREKEYSFPRLLQYSRTIRFVDVEKQDDEEVDKAADKVMDEVPNEMDKEKVKDSIKSFLSNDEEAKEKINSGEATIDDKKKIAAASVVYNVSGNINKAKAVVNKLPDTMASKALSTVHKKYSDEMLVKTPASNNSTDIVVNAYKPEKLTGGKSPKHIFDKRRIDFEINLKKDIENSFRVLESTDIPLKFQGIKSSVRKENPGELAKSDIMIFTVLLKDKFGNIHEVDIQVPKIDSETGTFRVNGMRKCIINQIIQNPITFPAPGESRFESSYSVFRISSKQLKNIKYLDSFMVYRMPFIYLLSFAFGFEESMKKYGIKYEITEDKPKTNNMFTKINETQYVVFSNLDTELKRQLAMSFIIGNPSRHKITKPFPSKEYFEDFIMKLSGRINSTFLISSHIRNVVDPVAKQILANKQLPLELDNIMKYMAEKVIEKYFIPRNDLSNQRIRNSEVIVHLLQKQILAAYTVYREQVIAGNENAKIVVNPTKTLADFQKSELVTAMEFANPIEEMSVITRVSPVGANISGIPNKRAIKPEFRNIHDSYFGNIDPLDTAESQNIGIVQQLTIDAVISSSRGLFGKKPITNNEGSGMLSTTSCLIPFIESDDGARVMMVANQSRQMLPLKNPEPPAVMSGYEPILTGMLSGNFVKRSPCDGKVLKITRDYIQIECKEKSKIKIDITPTHLRSGSGKNTLSVFKPTVSEGRLVKKGSIIAEGAGISSGSISLGKSLLVGFMPYKGYNFEDGVVINERLVENDKLTSLHGIEEEVIIEENDRILFISGIGNATDKGEILVRKTIGTIEQLVGYEDDDTVDTYAGQYIKRSPGGKIVDIDVFSNLEEDHFPPLKTFIQRTKKKYGMIQKEKFTIGGVRIKGAIIKFKIEQEHRTGLGDKL